MSIEAPEAAIIAAQMRDLVVGRRIENWDVRESDRLARSGFINRDLHDFDALKGRRIEEVTSRGNTVHTRLDRGIHLVLAPEYGGVVLFHADGVPPAGKFHLRLGFEEGADLTVRLTGMGGFRVARDADLTGNYVYRRDFLGAPDPLDAHGPSVADLAGILGEQNRMLKPVLVGKDAVVVGIGNALFQEIAWRAGIHPKRKASSLDAVECRALYRTIRAVLTECVHQGGKEGFVDLHGKPGRFRPAAGPAGAKSPCPRCGARFSKIAVGGGPSYYCPACQPAPSSR